MTSATTNDEGTRDRSSVSRSNDIEILPDAELAGRSRSQNLRPILWRLHFLGGFLAAPVVVSLAITGILFAWNPQIDNARFGDVLNASGETASVSLADQVSAAQEAHPEWTVFSVTPGTGGTNTAVLMDPPGGEEGFGGPADGVDVYVDQTTGEVTGSISQNQESGSILRGWHSSFGIGERAEPITELAGSWFLVSLITGVYLWWPSLKKKGLASIRVAKTDRGRHRSKNIHNLVGVTLFVPMFLLVVTGLTWTQYAGERFDLLKETVGADSFNKPVVIDNPANGQADISNIDAAYTSGLASDLEHPIQIVVPSEDTSPWTVSSRDTQFPVQRDVVMVDGQSGDVVDSKPYSDEHWFNKARTAGILFHQAELFGTVQQVLMTLLALGVVVMVFYGYKMWWQRKPAKSWGTPPPVRQLWKNGPALFIVGFITLCWLLPVLGVSLLAFLAIEFVYRSMAKYRQNSGDVAT